MRKFIAIFVVTLALGGCAQLQFAVQAATATFNNPVSQTNIYQVKNAYAAALSLADDWREYCFARSYAVLMKDAVAKTLCKNRRPVVRAIQSTRKKARTAIDLADNFVTANPTINAASVITAARNAVTAFQISIPKK